jgi:hypothetical protein
MSTYRYMYTNEAGHPAHAATCEGWSVGGWAGREGASERVHMEKMTIIRVGPTKIFGPTLTFRQVVVSRYVLVVCCIGMCDSGRSVEA